MTKSPLERWLDRVRDAVRAYALFQVAIGLFGGLLGNSAFNFVRRVTAPAVEFTAAYIGPVALQLAAVLGTFAVGTALYWFRCYSPRWYGTLEIAFGVAAAVYIVNQLLGNATGNAAIVFGEAAALYVIVRGYDNIYKSLEAEHRRGWNKLFFQQNTDQKL